MKHSVRAAAVLLSAALTALPCMVSAAAEEPMRFCVLDETGAASVQLWQSADETVQIPAGLWIRHYTGFSELHLVMRSDAPLTITDGDFTRCTDRFETDGYDDNGDPILVGKQRFFASHGTTIYTQQSVTTDDTNIVLWMGPGAFPTTGVPEDPDSSFLSFTLNVPAGTAPGVYTAYVGQEVQENSVGQLVYDFFAYNDGADVTAEFSEYRVVVNPLPLMGDVNCDGEVGADDAQRVLNYYTARLAQQNLTDADLETMFGTPYLRAALRAGSVCEPEREVPSVEDAQCILNYYTATLAEQNPQWEDILPKQ